MEKIKRNYILVVLGILSIIAFLLGIYYNSVRESKQISHYSFKDEPKKQYKIFFQRSSEDDSNRTTVRELFYFKPGSVVNITSNEAYHIRNLPDSETDKIYVYDFLTKESKVIFENLDEKQISDLYLYKGDLYFISNENLYKLNTSTQETELLAEKLNNVIMLNKNLPYAFEYNEFVNFTDDKIIITHDQCKFSKEKCNPNKIISYLTYNLKTKEISKFSDKEIEENLLKNTDFFGTNKMFRRGVNYKYEKDKGSQNYNLRIFTQF